MAAQDKTGTLGSVKKTVSVISDVVSACEVCGEPLHDETGQIHWQINHYLDHGYALLHVGQQTTRDEMEHPCQTTVAVLCKG